MPNTHKTEPLDSGLPPIPGSARPIYNKPDPTIASIAFLATSVATVRTYFE
jgi:hypothetical protein